MARRQHGYVTRGQLLALGVGAQAIKSQVRRGELIRIHAGVYAVGHAPKSPVARAAAAVLACGEGAVLSHASAVALWGWGRWPAKPEVSALPERRRPGIRTHRVTALPARDVRRQQGVRVSAPVRTVVDVASRYDDEGLVRLVNDARLACQLTPSGLEELADRCPRVRRLIGSADERPTRSRLEDRFRRFVVRHRLPMPLVNARVGGREVDALYPEQRLIIELDSWTYHRDRRSFERDRAKDAAALASGYLTVRITDARLTLGGAREAARIRRILACRR